MTLGKNRAALKIQRPSPSTTSYTVTNAPHLSALPAKLLRGLKLSVRLALAICCLTVLLLDLYVLASCPQRLRGDPALQPAFVDECLRRCVPVLQTAFGFEGSAWATVAVASGVLWLASRRDRTVESLLVIRGLGIQMSTSSTSFLSTATTRFIPTSQIQDIFIYEAFIGFEVKFYLAVIVEGEEEAVVVFPKLLPSRQILEEVWRGTKRTLYQASLKGDDR